MPDLDDDKHYTASDMRRARAEGERRGSRNQDQPGERDRPPAGLQEMIGGSEASSLWADPAFRREVITVAAKAAQVAVRNREDVAHELGVGGAHDDDVRKLLISEEKAKALIREAVREEVIKAFASIALDISDDATRLKTAMQLKRTFDLEESSTKLLKRIAWQAFAGFISFCFVALAAWVGITRR